MNKTCLTCKTGSICPSYCRVDFCNHWKPQTQEPSKPPGMILVNEKRLKEIIKEYSLFCPTPKAMPCVGNSRQCEKCILDYLRGE